MKNSIQPKIIKTKRKTISLAINAQAELVIRAPLRIRISDIHKLIEKHHDWINKHLNVRLQQINNKKPKIFADGESFLFLGKAYVLKVADTINRALIFDNGFFIHSAAVYRGKNMLLKWYKEQAQNVIAAQAHYYAALMGVSPGAIKITSAHTRWGSCSKNNLNFSWRLVMAPLAIIDYVVIHELSHILHKNHSQAFWKTVSSYCPEYLVHRKWLKQNGHLLEI